MRQKRSAFTLLELMVVIIILGLLASIVLPNLVGQASDAKRGTVCTQMKVLSNVLKNYKFTLGSYPTTEEGLQALVENPDPERYLNYPEGSFLDEGRLPKDAWSHPFIYTEDEGMFEIISLGADAKEGGEGEKADLTYSGCQKK
jgi:general secretion pathway protein G